MQLSLLSVLYPSLQWFTFCILSSWQVSLLLRTLSWGTSPFARRRYCIYHSHTQCPYPKFLLLSIFITLFVLTGPYCLAKNLWTGRSLCGLTLSCASVVCQQRRDVHHRIAVCIGQVCRSWACSSLNSREFWIYVIAQDVRLSHKSTVEALQLCQFGHVICYSAGQIRSCRTR